MFRLLVSLMLLAAPLAAQAAGDPRAEAASRSHTLDVYAQARSQLQKERAGQQSRAQQLAQEIAAAKRDRSPLSEAQLQARLREALDVARQQEATDRKLVQLDHMTRDTANALHALSSDRRLTDAERAAAERAATRSLAAMPLDPVGALDLDVRATAGMDADALRERADLAGDYEEKLRREAIRTATRIRELEAQASVAGEAMHLRQDRGLFDEEDRNIRGVRVTRSTAPQAPGTGHEPATTRTSDGTGTQGSAGQAPTAGAAGPSGESGSPSNAAAPPGGGTTGSFTDTTTGGDYAASPNKSASESVLPRSQTVVDQRTFALLRESRTPLTDLSPADELRQLQARRDALMRQAARLRALRDELDARARQARTQQR